MRNDIQRVISFCTFNVCTEIPSQVLRQQRIPKDCDKFILLPFPVKIKPETCV